MRSHTNSRPTRAAAVAVALLTLSGCAGAPAPAATTAATDPGASAVLAEIESIAVLGDSVSLGVNACDEPGWCPAVSWATGEDPRVASIATRVGELAGDFPGVENAAKDGGTVADAVERVDEVLAADPDLVLLLLGGNDVCKRDVAAMTSVEDFRASYSDLLGRLHAGAPDAPIVALSIPDLYHLWEIAHDDPNAVAVWNSSPSCRNLLGDADAADEASEERRGIVADHNAALNAVIAEVCTDAVGCTHDEGAVFAHEFTPSDISTIDFFHPSPTGEAVIAEIAWRVVQESVS